MLRAALVLATTASAAVASAPGDRPARPQVSPFGGSVAVHLAHVGHIEVALGPAGSAGLRRVQCAASVDPTTSCFVAR
ncbi:MAG TPA: hypothetical protein VGN06_07455 [Gaiellaceae bacterium]|jgi:hypothetical protein